MVSEFQHVSIAPNGKNEFDVLFNPNQYSLSKANQIADIGIPGLQAPILQFVHGNARTLDMELFFDTYEEQENVGQYTDKIYALLEIDPHTHVPPICTVTWGNLSFQGVLDHVQGKFTLFLPNGTPVRATLNVTFKEYLDLSQLVKQRPTESANHQKGRVIQRGDRLETIAHEEYGDPRKWRPIADANNLDDPSQLHPGMLLSIPPIV
jgi:Contractile injection system tube protein/LysM domain